MKKFFVKSAVFLLFPILYFGINMIINHYLFAHQEVKMEKKRVMIAGDSHAMKGLDPHYFSNAVNIAQTAEPYVLTYWKLKKIFRTVVPDTLILSCSPHNISDFNDTKFSNDNWSTEMFRRCYPIQELDVVSKYVAVDYKAYYKVLWKQTAFYPKKNHIIYIGHYTNTTKSTFADYDSTVKRHFYQQGKPSGVSMLAIQYLDSIIQLCATKKTEVILTGTPLHPSYVAAIPSGILNRYNELLQRYSHNHFVYNQTTVNYPDSLYLNCDHLNEHGARRFTKEIIEALKNGRSGTK